MVYYFLSNVVSPPVKLFMGFDKHESKYLREFVPMVFFMKLMFLLMKSFLY